MAEAAAAAAAATVAEAIAVPAVIGAESAPEAAATVAAAIAVPAVIGAEAAPENDAAVAGCVENTSVYTIREAQPSDREAVLTLIMNDYLTSEVLICNHSQYGKLFRTGTYNMSTVKPFFEQIIDKTTCLLAINENGVSVGMLIMATDGNDSFRPFNSYEYGIGLFETVFFTENLLSHLFIGKTPNLQNPVRLAYLTVTNEYRRRGIGTQLVDAAVKWARRRDSDVVYGIFSSDWSRKIAAKCGLRSIYDGDLTTARDREDGMRLFHNSSQNKIIVTIMTLNLKLVDS